ncbi:excalibur calcium-binding domain-containing protein [Microvirga zambiensis]|uniref:excalibur calcium-binding domain-containing protein n=1 Tax=Microvirga zambiensis TaxID=1402137 RepID=UPI001FEA69EB|nr:excalibur calcium-binding domain-containing protein [Microvirga zambiensis]
MAKLPKDWRVFARDDPADEFRRYKALVARHKTDEARRTRIRRIRQHPGQVTVWCLIVTGLGLLGWRMLNLEPLPPPPPPSAWPAEIRAKHIAARRSCEAARAEGLAPATRGYPGYWPHLDGDNDGVACEWSLGIPSISLHTLLGGK